MIIDAHSHWLPQEIIDNAHFFSKVWGDIESQVAAMDHAGVDKVVLSYPTSDAHIRMGSLAKVVEIYNERVAAILKLRPDRFVGAAILPVDDKKAMLDEFKRATHELGFSAISLATSFSGVFLDDARYLPLYEKAQKHRVPIFIHPQILKPIGSSVVEDPLLTPVIEYIFETTMCVGKLLMSGIFNEFPELKFIFAYFGGVTPFIANRYDSTYAMLRSISFVKDLHNMPSAYLKQIYIDTSGDRTIANFISSLELFGPEHILWGSDYPAKKDIVSSMEVLDRLNLTQADKKNILGENLNRILKEVKL
ncbi:MAG TPA: amidohydrolase family protein [Candidatus Omnitrophota bacterium]|nr:amidohydrolase family protein [Candidatus Omnitrophota bacterium]